MCAVLLPPGDNPIAFNKYIKLRVFLNFTFDRQPYMFWAHVQSIIRSLDTVLTANGICHTIYVDINGMTNTIYCEYSIKTPDDGQ